MGPPRNEPGGEASGLTGFRLVMARAGRPGRVAMSWFSWLKAAAAGRGRLRLAARVILLDPDGRVLLMRYDDGPPNGSHWTTPGGGLNEAEDYRAAALRELAEETGWSDIALLGEVARRRLTMEYGGRLVRQRERLYLARTDQACREIRGVDAMHAADGIAAWRWWTLAELDATAETIWPAGLADLIRNVPGQA